MPIGLKLLKQLELTRLMYPRIASFKNKSSITKTKPFDNQAVKYLPRHTVTQSNTGTTVNRTVTKLEKAAISSCSTLDKQSTLVGLISEYV